MGGGIKSHNIFEKIISPENLFLAWSEFRKGKRNKPDVQEFEYNLEDNIFSIYNELKNKTYRHSDYISFYIKDPKLRHIHKAIVKDRVLHHAVFRILYPIFDKSFIFDSYSCRNKKGIHKAVNRLNNFAKKAGKNNTKTCYVLKCDIKKYFNSINQDILVNLIKKKIKDNDVIWLVEKIIKSFPSGLPLGNITSQLFANVYLNELDRLLKNKLKEKFYIRYCDDFVILKSEKKHLQSLILKTDNFLKNNLNLCLHPYKISIRRYNQGIDFLGYVSFSHHRTLRTKTKNRMVKKLQSKEIDLINYKITKNQFNQTLQSYLGILKHCDSYKIKRKFFNKFLGMIIFLYGEDTYRSKKKLEEIVGHYKKIHKSGLNLIYIDSQKDDFKNLTDSFKIVSMFSEKKLIVLKNVFSTQGFQENFLKDINKLKEAKDIIVIFEEEKIDERNKLFKTLKKEAKCQEFDLLKGATLLNWIKNEFKKNNAKTDFGVDEKILNYAGNNLWQLQNEIKKIADFKAGKTIKTEDIDLLIKPKIETDIFKTIDAMASKNKRQALSFLQKHLENGDNVLYLLSMIAYQFKSFLIIKELMDKKIPYSSIAKKSGLHPFVVKKGCYFCSQFSFFELKKIYQKIFQADLDIKTGKVDPETALGLLISEI